MNIEVTIDWLSCTFQTAVGLQMARDLQLGQPLGRPTRKAQFGYNRIRQFEGGAVLMWSDGREDMGAHLVLSGSALRTSHALGMTPIEVARICHDNGGRCSRIDLAIDVINSDMSRYTFDKTERLKLSGKGRHSKLTSVIGEDES